MRNVILSRALGHVEAKGWTAEALAAGAEEAGFSQAATGQSRRRIKFQRLRNRAPAVAFNFFYNDKCYFLNFILDEFDLRLRAGHLCTCPLQK